MSSPGYNTRKGNNLPGQWSGYPTSAMRRKNRRLARQTAEAIDRMRTDTGLPYKGLAARKRELLQLARNG